MNTINLPFQAISDVFEAISSPIRIQILLAIGTEEACVCHLENVLNLRQAFISQHLMVLREAGLVIDRREGRFIYYSLRDPALLDLLQTTARMQKLDVPSLIPAPECDCPKCRNKRVVNHELHVKSRK
jgi:DNA-binding transcriptional ArsR family regulator